MQTWMIGNTSVTRIEEQVGPNDLPAGAFLPGLVREKLEPHLPWLVPVHYDPATDKLITSNHSWLIRTERHTILLDCCAGNHKNRPWLPRFHQLNVPFMERLRAAEVSPEDIDIVLCTHLHADHVGWNTRLENGRWIPTFPNARYLFSRTEQQHWDPSVGDRRIKSPGRAEMYDDSVLPVIESGQSLLLDGEYAIDERLIIKPAPGHTPGHVVLHLADHGQRALFCGDVCHHPIQVHEPDWSTRFCEDPDLARITRKQALAHCVDSGALLFPTHFASPHVARITSSGAGFGVEFVSSGTSGRA